MKSFFLAGAGALLVIAGCDTIPRGVAAPWPAGPSGETETGVKSNDQCYVCHIPFSEEALALVHAKAEVWCIRCHGRSAGHMQDENIGATPPDIAYKKHQVDRMCAECHKPKKHPTVAPDLRAARLGEGSKAQQEIKGRRVKVTGVCTDCHGRHWIPPREK